MLTSKPKHKIKRMLPEDLPQPAELPESEESPVEEFQAEDLEGGGAHAFKSAALNLAESARALKAEPEEPTRPGWVQQVVDYVEREVPAEARVQNIAQLHKL